MKFKAVVTVFILFGLSASAQENTRRIWPEELMKPQAKTQTSKNVKKPAYKIATPAVIVDKVNEDTVVGVTIWRLRPAAGVADAATIDSENAKWIPERVEAKTVLSEGDRVRLSIEAARNGYLYVINREQYRDGSMSEPYLIFPTSRLKSGDNKTQPGRIIEIPSQSDNPPYFTLTPGRSDQIAEMLSVLILPQPIENIDISDQPAKLSSQQVAEWENSWGKATGRLEMVDGAGKPWTETEKQAGLGTRLLKHEDPPPQTVYYNPDANAGDPAFINIDLQYGKRN